MTIKWKGAQVTRAVQMALMRGLIGVASDVRNTAVESITDGKKSGRIYKRRGIVHRASAPGEPPAADTGTLHGSIDLKPHYSQLRVEIQATANYAAALEYGTEYIEPRPFMRPALYQHIHGLQKRLALEVRFTLGG